MTLRQDFIRMAVADVPTVIRVLPQLSTDEILAALELESSTKRRKTVLDRLIARYVEVQSRLLRESLIRKFK